MNQPNYSSATKFRMRRSHSKWFALSIVLILMVGIALVVQLIPKSWFVSDLSDEVLLMLPTDIKNEMTDRSDNSPSVIVAKPLPQNTVSHARTKQLKQRFSQAVIMLHAKQYQFAINELHEILKIAPAMPEAHANMGFAMMGADNFISARDFFETAIELNPKQYNAYYGLALCYFQLGDEPQAIGAMESYLHRVPDSSHYEKGSQYLKKWRKNLASNSSEAVPSVTP